MKKKNLLKNRVKEFWNKNPCSFDRIELKEGTHEFFLTHDKLIERLYPYSSILQYGSCFDKRVLEVGCGMGSHSLKMASYAQEFYALDFNFRSTSITKKRFETFGKKARVMQADAENLPYGNNTFDRIYSLGVIHHTVDTQKAADEIYRVLKKGGDAILMLYYKNSIFYYWDVLVRLRLKYLLIKLLPNATIDLIARLKPSVKDIKKDVSVFSWQDLTQYAIRVSDGRANPVTKVYTKQAASELVRNFS